MTTVPAPVRRRITEALQAASGEVVTACWSRVLPPDRMPAAPMTAPSDSLQRAMNLVMPLRLPGVIWRGSLAQALFEATDEILVGLNTVGTVHFARFDLVGNNLCMFSIYDGDFSVYIRDFVATIGAAFDAVMHYVKRPPPTPVRQHVDEFVEWVNAHDALQLPEEMTDLAPDLTTLRRAALVTLYRHRNVQLGVYRNYPGFSAAQIRQRLSLGW